MKNEDERVDFAIVTALPVERDAVLKCLDEYKKVQEDNESTYYHGYVTISDTKERYEIIVALLTDIGNLKAASVTTRIIERWNPLNVIMVGIAGGVRDKVELGDVVVAKFVCYYELAKITDKEDERRIRQFPCASLLIDRTLNLNDKWKKEIRISSSNTHLSNQPNVHFGAIASGEKVIADSKTLPQLLKKCPELKAIAMEGAGVAEAVELDSIRFIEIRGISDLANPDKNDDWHSDAANAAATFTMALLRSRPFTPYLVKKRRQQIWSLVGVLFSILTLGIILWFFNQSYPPPPNINWQDGWDVLHKQAVSLKYYGIVEGKKQGTYYYIGAKDKVGCVVVNVPGYHWFYGKTELGFFDEKKAFDSSTWIQQFDNKLLDIISIGSASNEGQEETEVLAKGSTTAGFIESRNKYQCCCLYSNFG
jgi:5'-methylthioadenosine/S-adenosylhomocysteine nucleosidase